MKSGINKISAKNGIPSDIVTIKIIITVNMPIPKKSFTLLDEIELFPGDISLVNNSITPAKPIPPPITNNNRKI